MKKMNLLLALLVLYRVLAAQNPVCPPGVFLADPSAHVWQDGALFVYGSLDESCRYYCSHRHHVLMTRDMLHWELAENVFSSAGPGDAVDYNDALLYAPDCAFRKDSFYLYYCQPDKKHAGGVAVSRSAAGPFERGMPLDLGGHEEIDPSLFVDDDGQAYYLWGQFSLKMARMEPSMRRLDLSSLHDSILTEEEHHFHEGAFLAKRNGIYYLVYADISRADMPTCIGYATSRNIWGPYTYGGVIIDNDHCNPGNWNNHGSIAAFNGTWYVFYHRSTHGCNTMRKACVEPISFLPDGSIPEVEMTSQGAAGPLPAKNRIEAEWACLLYGNVRVEEGADGKELLSGIHHADRACYKYIDFGDGADSLILRISPGSGPGRLVLCTGQPWHQDIAVAEVPAAQKDREWSVLSVPLNTNVTGIHAVWLKFYGEGGEDLFRLDWFRFH